MLCPICKTELKITGKARLVSSSEHVMGLDEMPNGITVKDRYQCPNRGCVAYEEKLIWNELGEFYIPNYTGRHFNFINGNNAPFGSWERKVNVEIYKHDEDWYLFKFPIGKGYAGKVVYSYKADEDGNVLSRKCKLQLIIGGAYYISGIHMLKYCLSTFYEAKREYKKTKSKFWLERLQEEFVKSNWDKRWWRQVYLWWIHTFYGQIRFYVNEEKENNL